MAEPTVDADYRLYRHPTTSKGEAAQLPANSAPLSCAASGRTSTGCGAL